MVVVGAGSSAGSKDYSKRVFESIGSVLVHGISVMPGKPTLLAVTDERSGLSGPAAGGLRRAIPVSAIVCHEKIPAPLVALAHGQSPLPERREADIVLARKTPSRPGMREAIRLAAGRIGENIVAAPLARGAGMITTMTKAQAVTYIPRTWKASSRERPYGPNCCVREANSIGCWSTWAATTTPWTCWPTSLMGLTEPLRLVSSHAGSMGGLTALKAGSALFAGAHLFDPETGDFNFPFIERYLNGPRRDRGQPGHPPPGTYRGQGQPTESIRGVDDLTRDDVIFINRQRGAERASCWTTT